MEVSLRLDYNEAVNLRARLRTKPFPAVIEDIIAILDEAIRNEAKRRSRIVVCSGKKINNETHP